MIYVLTILNCMIKVIKIDKLNVKVKSIDVCYLIDLVEKRGQELLFGLSGFKELI